MMIYPTNQQIIAYHSAFLVTGPLLLLVSSVCWLLLVRSLLQKPRPSITIRLPVFAVFTLLIGTLHFAGTYSRVWQARQWQFQLEDVQELRITRMDTEYSQTFDKPIIVTNHIQIMEGLALLRTAQVRQRNHEGFSQGYRIQLVTQRAAPGTSRYLSVFTISNGTKPVTVVKLQARSSQDSVLELSSPAFLAWVQRVVQASP